MAKFTAFQCDGCGKVERGSRKKKRSRYGYGYGEMVDVPPTGWESLSVPGSRGHVCSEDCVDKFAKATVDGAVAKARESFAKKAAKGKK